MVAGTVPRMPAPTPAALKDADKAGTRLHTKSCHTRVMVESLPAHVQAALIQAMLTPSVKNTDIVTVLETYGLPARAENLARHRRRLTGGRYACKCPVPIKEGTPS